VKSRRLWRTAWTICAILQMAASGAFAADELHVDLIPLGPRARNEAPIPVEARFKWNSTRILEGRLEMEFLEGNQVLGRYRSGEMALTGGEQKFQMLLPPTLAPFSDPQVQVQMRFVTAGNTLEIEPSSLSVPTASERSLVVGWCDSGTAADRSSSELVRNMLFERFVPPSDNLSRRLLMTSVMRLDPDNLPAQPLAYTSFDVVVLTAEAFKQTSERQLQALARWVKGGGSVCVFVAGGLQPRHVDFLNQLAEATPDGSIFLTDSAGDLLPALKGSLFLHSGVGRAVIVPANNGVSANADWRAAATFLWKVRSEWLQTMAETQQKEPATNEATSAAPMEASEYASRFSSFQTTNRTPMMLANRKPMNFETIDGILALTDDEKPKIKAALDEWSDAMKQSRSVPPVERRNKLLAARQAFRTNLQAILTPDQLNKFQATFPRIFTAFPSLRPQILNNRIPSIVPAYGNQPSMLANELLSLLMPHTVRLIPFSALIGLLALFLAMIGPVDYYLLGFFRRRKYTWILFPATSLAFTMATVLMANHYLGLRDQRRSLIVVDLARDGTALRWNRFELVFAARDKQSVTELKDALWAPLDVRAMTTEYNFRYNGYNMSPYREPPGREAGPPLYDGVLPVHFKTSEAIRQWQPEVNRIFSFAPPPVPMIPDWRAIEEAWPNLQKMRAKLSQNKSFSGDLYAISSSNSITASSGYADILPATLLNGLCLGDSKGLLSLVSQISPTGGGSFEDMQAMDTETNDSVLNIVTWNGDDIVVYRRFFYGN